MVAGAQRRQAVRVDERSGTGCWIDIAYTKWPDQAHYAYRMRVLGEDDHGVWGACEVGEEVYKAGQLAFVREHGYLSLIPRASCWSGLWYPPAEPNFEVYVDINSQPVWTDSAVSMVDLDLDVLRHRDGTVELLDEDEFEDHQQRFAYPDELTILARTSAQELMRRVSEPDEPFRSVWRAWHRLCFPEVG
jgi:uncharacterized protein